MSESLRDPQIEPSDHCWVILQDHGPNDGGWGPAAVVIPPLMTVPRPFVYTGSMPLAIEAAKQITRELAQASGKPTRLVCFTVREDVFVVGGSS